VHQLTRAEAAESRRAVIRGVVTCVWPDAGALVVQDATRGIYIDGVGFAEPAPRVGHLVEIEGVTGPGEFAPQLHARRVTILGRGELPPPIQATWDRLSNGSLDTQYAEIQGVVTSAPRTGGLTLLTPGGSLRVRVFDAGPTVLTGAAEYALVRLRGVVGASWDAATHRLRVGEICVFAPEVMIEEPPPADLFALPRKRVFELLQFDPLASALRPLRISGQVTHQRDAEVFLMDGTNGFRITLGEPVALAGGALVDVVGFPVWTGPSPGLREARVRVTGRDVPPPARFLTEENLFRLENDAVRARLQATLLNRTPDGRTLDLQAGLRRFVARLDASPGPPARIPPGSRLELAGTYAGVGAIPSPTAQFASFELLIGAPADIRVLARPSWWTWRRWLALVATLGAFLAGTLFWVRRLQRRVGDRTARLREEIRVREQAERQRALAQERARIARDLHDDLGSTLTEITMLATPGGGHGPGAGEEGRLGMIAHRSRILIHALDEIVWAVDSGRDTLASVAHYLAGYAEERLASGPVACRVQIPHSLPAHDVPGQVRHQLFLAVKEALNNALRHSGASEISFQLRLLAGLLVIEVGDNGRGFNPRASSAGDGLRNLDRRLRDLGGRCVIDSTPGRGTAITLELPLPAREPVESPP
jgi:signal transduction histidine kinase